MRLVMVLDCGDPASLSQFWTNALGYRLTGHNEQYWVLRPAESHPDRPELLLQRVPEPKTGKNRMHLDIRTDDFEAETRRLLALGATLVSDEPFDEEGYRWYVLADPEGNEFCVVGEPE